MTIKSNIFIEIKSATLFDIHVGNKIFNLDLQAKTLKLHQVMQEALNEAFNKGQIDVSIDLVNTMHKEYKQKIA